MRRLAITAALLLCVPLTARAAGGAPWAFQKPRHVRPPQVRTDVRMRNPVDAFLLARLHKEGLDFAPEADRDTLLRRVTYTLTGLPPTPEERRRFLDDTGPGAYERLVERLLASPHFGERWAQHWLDVTRYAESNGYELDGIRPHAWRYRDYVVRAFNQDKPYDEFLAEQLAGDLLAKQADGTRRDELLIAAGFHRCGPVHLVSGNLDKETLRQEVLTEMTDAVGAVFLGLTVGCARCHDHKFDPISQKDYYQLEAFFSSAFPKDVSIATEEEQAAVARAKKKLAARIAPLSSQVSVIEAPARKRLLEQKTAALDPKTREALATKLVGRTPEQHRLVLEAQPLLRITWDEIIAELSRADVARRSSLRRQIHDLEAHMPPPPSRAWTLAGGPPTPSHILKRGSVKRKGAKVSPAMPETLARACPPIKTSEEPDRIALSRWLTRPDHPLTARVLVNRLWQHHTGRGLVATPNDFGTRGSPPTHPELLDWLARELVRSGWSLKHVHRLIVTSSAYRQDSVRHDARGEKVDPENRLLWRMNRQRLDAEALRDAMLSVSGELNRELGGPMVLVPIEPSVHDLIFTEGEPDNLWPVTPDPREHGRRSLYLFHKRNVRLPLLEGFDQPDALRPCARRAESIFAPQALVLLNGPFSQAQSRALARRLIRECKQDARPIVRRGFELTRGRPPRPSEMAISLEFLQSQAHRLRLKSEKRPAPPGADAVLLEAVSDLCLALLNANEFLYIR
jgi:hypothetical protein